MVVVVGELYEKCMVLLFLGFIGGAMCGCWCGIVFVMEVIMAMLYLGVVCVVVFFLHYFRVSCVLPGPSKRRRQITPTLFVCVGLFCVFCWFVGGSGGV